jgi:hypothetical protein
MRHDGGLTMALAGGLGFAVALYNFFAPTGLFAPLSDVAGTPGAALVVLSTAALALAGLALAAPRRHALLAALLLAGCLAAILGTALAARLLDSPPLLAAMALAGLGWLMRLFGRAA